MNREITPQHTRQRTRLRWALGDAVRYGRLAGNVCGTSGQRASAALKTKMNIWKKDQINAALDANSAPKSG